jgi:hypothetical protein
MKVVIPVLIAFLWLSCKNNSPTSTAKQEEKKVDSISQIRIDSGSVRLVISFYSIGEGAEAPFMNALEDSIGSFSLRIGKNFDYEKTPWGREGETDFCMSLNELTPAEQADFINRTKITLSKAKWVHIYENAPCRHRHKK